MRETPGILNESQACLGSLVWPMLGKSEGGAWEAFPVSAPTETHALALRSASAPTAGVPSQNVRLKADWAP